MFNVACTLPDISIRAGFPLASSEFLRAFVIVARRVDRALVLLPDPNRRAFMRREIEA
jgi:hypothetical protein